MPKYVIKNCVKKREISGIAAQVCNRQILDPVLIDSRARDGLKERPLRASYYNWRQTFKEHRQGYYRSFWKNSIKRSWGGLFDIPRI